MIANSTKADWRRGKRNPLDNRVPIATPENIQFQYDVAGPFRRLTALLLDAIVVSIGFMILLGTSALVDQTIGGFAEWIGRVMLALISVVIFVVFWFYGFFCEARFNGKTIGKAMLAIRTVSTDGRPINVTQAGLRNMVRMADCFPWVSLPLLFGIEVGEANLLSMPTMAVGLVVMAMTSRYQRLGDLVAGTMVIIEDPGYLAHQIAFDDGRVPRMVEAIPPQFTVDRELTEALAEYASRRDHFSVQRRREIALHVAGPLIRQFQWRPDTDPDLLLCALYHRTFVGSEVAAPATMELPGHHVPESRRRS